MDGISLVLANRTLREAAELWQSEPVAQFLSLTGITWRFNPPAAPHHGGLWEAAVKATKHHLKRLGGGHTFTFEQLATLLAKITACLNSRPLTPLSTDPKDLLVLTPGHFLTGQPIITPLQPAWSSTPSNRLNAWQRIEQMRQEFWNRWRDEYLMELHRRNKCADHQRAFRIGDLVFVRKENTPPCHWPRGRIQELLVGPQSDGIVRSVRLTTETGEMERPITQLVLLPMQEQSAMEEDDD